MGNPLQNSGFYFQLVELNKLRKKEAQWGNHLQNYGCSPHIEEPAVLIFDMSIFSEILSIHQHILIIVSVGPGLGIALCCFGTSKPATK